MNTKTNLGLEQLRDQIDSLDAGIQKLINERAELATVVRASKSQVADGNDLQSLDFYRPEREAQVLRKVLERNEGPLSDAEMLRLFREIMSACLAQQKTLRIAYLGPEGTFTQQAVVKQFGHSVQSLAHATIDDVFTQVESGEADFGVVPIENSSQGMVANTLDRLLTSPLKICAEVELFIHHNLMTNANCLKNIKRVYSHPQSLAQCQLWLRENLPQAQSIPQASNAAAAKHVRDQHDAAAIAGRNAALIYDLPILVSSIEDQADNTTRFLVIGRKLCAPSGNDRTTLLMAGNEGPGGLHALLQPIAEAGLNMTKIESRPTIRGKWSYVFFMDLDGHADNEPMQTVIRTLQKRAQLLRVLGAYPKAVEPRQVS